MVAVRGLGVGRHVAFAAACGQAVAVECPRGAGGGCRSSWAAVPASMRAGAPDYPSTTLAGVHDSIYQWSMPSRVHPSMSCSAADRAQARRGGRRPPPHRGSRAPLHRRRPAEGRGRAGPDTGREPVSAGLQTAVATPGRGGSRFLILAP